ncbi:MAG: ubiquinol-cytochrome C chaperone [Sphingomonadales bacterium]|nr:ubiquinol-cytochrome C chaperone [Sphingomonadales bacterium]
MIKALASLLFAPRTDPRDAVRPLYAAVVAAARAPHWYRDGGVADSVDGRFEMIAALLALTIKRLEDLPGQQATMALLTEIFVEDMDAQLRQEGIGDVVVGKHVGKMMGALGGRIAAYGAGLSVEGDPAPALRRNLYRGGEPGAAQLDHAIAAMRDFRDRLARRDAAALLAGDIGAGSAA